MDNHQILQEGDLVQWYRIEKVLGRGGFGVTYLATDTNLDHKVAIKEYMPGWAVERREDNSLAAINDDARRDFDVGVANFLREARTLVKFRHPNIVRVMTVFEANSTAYLVMEYEEGDEFKSYVQRGNGVDEHTLLSLILSIVDGLDQVHQYGFLHRDIKPVNVIIRKDGTPVLLDFGAARPTDGEAGKHTSVVSAGYTPIEQYQEGDGMQVGPWTDIYALGATVYYAISGNTPIGPTGRLAAMVTKSPDPLDPARVAGAGRYSEPFLEAIDWALCFRPTDRPRDLTEWREAFEHEHYTEQPPERVSWQPEESASEYRPDRSAGNNGALPKRSSVGLWATALASIAALVLAGTWFFRDYQKQLALDGMLKQANAEFSSGDYVDGALPLYRQVLGSAPDNQIAKSRLSEIEAIYVAQIESAIDSGELDQAEISLQDFKVVSSDTSLANTFQQQINHSRDSQAIEQQFNTALALDASGQHRDALNLLVELRNVRPDDPRITEIESSARSALDKSQALAQQREKEEAEKLAEQSRLEKQTKQRIADANRRQRQLRQTYISYLGNAEAAVSEGDIVTARQWLDDARAMQFSDERLASLESQVVAQETFQRKPLSDYEVSYATGQFNALRNAVESKNQRVIDSLSEGSPSRAGLFGALFDRYTRLDAKIIDVKPDVDPKRVTAKLRIEAMIFPNGDIGYPSDSYKDTELTLNRQRYGWSRIVW